MGAIRNADGERQRRQAANSHRDAATSSVAVAAVMTAISISVALIVAPNANIHSA